MVHFTIPQVSSIIPEYNVVELRGYTSFVFRVKSCESVHLLLSFQLSSPDDRNGVEIKLGYKDNSATAITRTDGFVLKVKILLLFCVVMESLLCSRK